MACVSIRHLLLITLCLLWGVSCTLTVTYPDLSGRGCLSDADCLGKVCCRDKSSDRKGVCITLEASRPCYPQEQPGCKFNTTTQKHDCTGTCAPGKQVCEGGTWSRCRQATVPIPEVCINGLDDDCDGAVDKGQEFCDGKDNNCDGRVDNDRRVGVDLNRPCYRDVAGCTKEANGTYLCTGTCKTGIQYCKTGAWGPCEGDKGAEGEYCDGKDNDCDGTVDEDCTCPEPGKQRTCYTGTTGCTRQNGGTYQCTGTCTAGTQTCLPTGWSTCQGEQTPQTETCNLKDDDCNGTVDDLELPCTGCRARKGVQRCEQGKLLACSTSKQDEICDGLDNDCDGMADQSEGAILRRKCYQGPQGTQDEGECVGGEQVCLEGRWGPCQGQVLPTDEIPDNGQDDDCDGEIDEQDGSDPAGCWRQVGEQKLGNLVTALAYSPGGQQLAAGLDNSQLALFSATPGQTKLLWQTSLFGGVRRIAYSPTQKLIATIGTNIRNRNAQSIGINVVETGKGGLQRGIPATGKLLAIAFSPDGSTLASVAEKSDSVHLWDISSGAKSNTLSIARTFFHDLQFHPNGQTLFVAGPGGLGSFSLTTKIYNLLERTSLDFLYFANPGLYGVANDLVHIFDTKGGNILSREHSTPISGFAVHPAGDFIATSADTKQIRLLTKAGTRLATITHSANIVALAVTSTPENTIAAATDDRKIVFFRCSSSTTCQDGQKKPCQTACGAGNAICQNGLWLCQVRNPSNEICDGVDNDCDGKIDEDCPCPSLCNKDLDCQRTACSTRTKCGPNNRCIEGTP